LRLSGKPGGGRLPTGVTAATTARCSTRVRAHLDRASNYPYGSGGDRRRFDDARRELFDFECRFDQGRYDKHELD
jgi:hypothetical protein